MTWADTLRADPCSYCGGRGGCVDHIDPRSRGGSDLDANLAGVCRSCNSSKGIDSPLVFLLRGKATPQHREGPHPDAVDLLIRIGSAMRAARSTYRYSQAELARRVGVSTQTIFRWERGASGAALSNLDRIAAAFDRPGWNWLLRGELIYPAKEVAA